MRALRRELQDLRPGRDESSDQTAAIAAGAVDSDDGVSGVVMPSTGGTPRRTPLLMLNGLLADPSAYPTFDDPNYKRETAAAAKLTGPQRYLAFDKLALSLARDSAPIVPYGFGVSEEYFSPRTGCQTYGVYQSADLAALCIRRPHQ